MSKWYVLLTAVIGLNIAGLLYFFIYLPQTQTIPVVDYGTLPEVLATPAQEATIQTIVPGKSATASAEAEKSISWTEVEAALRSCKATHITRYADGQIAVTLKPGQVVRSAQVQTGQAEQLIEEIVRTCTQKPIVYEPGK